MKKFKDKNGEAVQGDTAPQIVSYLRDSSKFSSHESLEEFMKGMSDRLMMLHGWYVRFDSEENFVEDLVKYKWLVHLD